MSASVDAGGYALFDTAIGRCGIAWTARGIAAIQLPERTDDETRARMAARLPYATEETTPAHVRKTVDRIAAVLAGGTADLRSVALDVEGLSPFRRRVYEAARAIPTGSTISYAELARRVGAHRAMRAIGQALAHNPFAVVVPCHRVLSAGGRAGGFSAVGGVTTKMAMLAAEGASLPRGGGRGLLFDWSAAVAQLRAVDATLGSVIDTAGPHALEPRPARSLFADLAEAIVYQQLSGKAAATIHARVRALPGGTGRDPTPDQILGATEEHLRAAGLSRAKIAALRDLADRAATGRPPSLATIRKLDDEKVIEQLTEVRGIGVWSAQMFLIFRLGRPDVLPADDLGLRKEFAAVFGGSTPSPEDVLRRGERWRPYPTAATWYLWQVVDGGGL